MPQYQYVKLTAADKTALGLDDFDADNLRKYVVGANSVRPRRAIKTITTTDNKVIRMTTFCAYNKEDSLDGGTAAAGWSLLE